MQSPVVIRQYDVTFQDQPPQPASNRGFFQPKAGSATKEPASTKFEAPKQANQAAKNDVTAAANVGIDSLPLVTNDVTGDKVLRMYWLNAYEDPFKHAGTVWLFGKVYVEKAKTFVSCCVTIKNIERNVFLLKRDTRMDLKTGKPILDDEGDAKAVTLGDVYEEFNSKVAVR